MLSRIAESMFWIGRYIERAENVARFIAVNLNLNLDMPGAGEQQWLPLVVTTGERRLKNMLLQAKRGGTQGLFYFTTYEQLTVENFLQMPIWRRADRDEPVPLVFVD